MIQAPEEFPGISSQAVPKNSVPSTTHSSIFGTLAGRQTSSVTPGSALPNRRPTYRPTHWKKAGCIRVWTDKASGSLDHRPKLEAVLDHRPKLEAVLDHRPKLEAVLDHLRLGDTLIVWRLDRLGRNLRHLIATVNDLAAAGVGFQSLTERIDTTTPSGRLTFHLFGALAEFERELIRERTAAGLAAARARGRSGGRPRVMTPEKLAVARQMYESRGHTLAAIAAVVGVSRTTLFRYLGDQGRPRPPPPRKRPWLAGRASPLLRSPRHTVQTLPSSPRASSRSPPSPNAYPYRPTG